MWAADNDDDDEPTNKTLARPNNRHRPGVRRVPELAGFRRDGAHSVRAASWLRPADGAPRRGGDG